MDKRLAPLCCFMLWECIFTWSVETMLVQIYPFQNNLVGYENWNFISRYLDALKLIVYLAIILQWNFDSYIGWCFTWKTFSICPTNYSECCRLLHNCSDNHLYHSFCQETAWWVTEGGGDIATIVVHNFWSGLFVSLYEAVPTINLGRERLYKETLSIGRVDRQMYYITSGEGLTNRLTWPTPLLAFHFHSVFLIRSTEIFFVSSSTSFIILYTTPIPDL